MKNASSSVRILGRAIARVFVPVLLIAAGTAHATSGAKALEGMWCSEDASRGETIVQYSAAGSDITAFTVLSEADPRQIGSQSSMHVTAAGPNVFVRRAFNGDEMFSVHSGRLTVNSLRIWNRGTSEETRHVLATQTYYKCDMGQALRRAQAFLSSPKAEEATRLALQREADAQLEERRNASKDAYYAGLIRQLNQARFAR
ncbi:MAG TPA: hypothetical protein VGD45_05130 [Steroidobacter sp.]|uniref:hypothetical protein n=1 Tax=Steroidobacter sp. TaxID=1978227 RepID=UPI002EDA9813